MIVIASRVWKSNKDVVLTQKYAQHSHSFLGYWYCRNVLRFSKCTQIKKLSSVESLGAADEVAEVMMEFAFNHEDIVNRIARKAIEQKLVFSADSLIDLTNSIDPLNNGGYVDSYTESQLERAW